MATDPVRFTPAETPAPPPAPPPPVAETAVMAVSAPSVPTSWLHRNVRSVLLLLLGLMVCWLAYQGNEAAIAGVVGAFTGGVGYTFGERGALKVPGRDS